MISHGAGGDSQLVPWGVVRRWECQVCGFVYDEAEGLPEGGFSPGTLWEEIPESWVCPDCGTAKSEFEMLELVA